MKKRTSQRAPARRSSGRSRPKVGVWIFGALGGLATTVVVGTRAIARGLTPPRGLMTALPICADLGLCDLDDLVFGGHEVRDGSAFDAALEIYEANGTLRHPLLLKLKADLARYDAEIRPGSMSNAGRTIARLAGERGRHDGESLADQVERLTEDIRDFMRRHRLDRCVCVNLTSTEPKLEVKRTHMTSAALERAIERNQRSTIRPSTLYAWAAASLGLPFVHFTPSNAALLPGVCERFDANGAPFMGSDGKTGETLVKSALAPMFKYRDLRVLTWQGYNILGDRDGAVLAEPENKAAKVESKDALLASILGYPLHTHVGIDYVPSLNDLKTAWDFVHFEGFLGHRMSLQFTWQGCDAILAAPLVLDMVRFADLARRRGETGPMRHLACFFKRPLTVDEHDLHLQWHLLTEYIAAAAPDATPDSARDSTGREQP